MGRVRRVWTVAGLALLAACGGGEPPGGRLCSIAPELPAQVEGELVVGDECANWVARQGVHVGKDARIVVRAGTTITFEKEAYLDIGAGGALKAEGTADEPILFTGLQHKRGFWRGVRFSESPYVENVLNHVRLENAGAPFDGALVAAAIVVTKGSRLSLQNTTVLDNLGYALHLDNDVVLQPFGSNTFTENEAGPASVFPVSAKYLLANSQYTGNDRDIVHVHAGEVDAQTTWRSLGIPFHAEALTVRGGFTVDPGVTVSFVPGGSLRVTGAGYLEAIGTINDRIRFSATEGTRGAWQGIAFDGASHAQNQLEHVIVEFAGKAPWTNTSAAAGISLIGNGSAIIRNSVVQLSGGFGIELGDQARAFEFTGNTLSKNRLGPASVGLAAAGDLRGTNTLTGNDVDYVRLSVDGPINSAMTLRRLDVPWRVQALLEIHEGGHLTLTPGIELQFVADAGILVDGGALSAIGGPSDRIVLTRSSELSTKFIGVGFIGASGAENRLEYVDITYGGGFPFVGAEEKANLVVMDGASVALSEVALKNSDGYGLWVHPETGSISGCDTLYFLDNTLGTSNISCP